LSVDHIDGVVGDSQFVEFGENPSHVPVVLDHAVRIDAQSSLAFGLLLQVGEDVHSRRVPPAEERLAGLMLALNEVECGGAELFVDGLHALPGQRTGILDRLSPVRLRPGAQNSSGSEPLLEFGILRVVGILGLLLGVEMVKVAEELIEAVHSRQEFVPVAKMVLAELAANITQGLQKISNGRVFRLKAEFCSGHSDLGQTGADRRLSRDERGATGRAALLAVPVSEHRALLGDAVNVRRAVAHDAVIVGADVEPSDVVAPENENVWFVRFGHRSLLSLVDGCLLGFAQPGASGETHQHGEEGEQANEDEQDADSENRRVHRLLGHACDRRKGFLPQVMQPPPIFPNRDDKREHSAGDERKTQKDRRVRQIGGVRFRRLLQALEELDDGEAEADQGGRGAQPRHHGAFEAETGADPAEMAV
jgi:hypothetical protein